MQANVNTEGTKKQIDKFREIPRSEQFKPFRWVPGKPRSAEVDLLGAAKDIVSGVALVLQIIESSEHQLDGGETPLFNENKIGTLQRFTISACNTLHKAIDDHLYRLTDVAKGGK
jgi:hypothetical protein